MNEGVVEWPPSPWRLLRTLIAVGFSKLAWTDVPTDAHELLETLASALPTYWLPRASAAHTRHYMPANEGRKVRSDKVIDAFAEIGRHSELGIVWDVAVDDASLAVLDRLLGGVAYLGRAESWTDVRRVDQTVEEGRERCAPSDLPPLGRDRVPLLAPIDPGAYATWRNAELARVRDSRLNDARVAALAKGKKPPAKLSAKEEDKLAAPYPPTLIDALRTDTGALQACGWSQPPGSRWVSYWRPSDALAARSPIAAPRSNRGTPTLALLTVASDTIHGNRLPAFADTVLRFEALHAALVRRSDTGEGSSWCFTGRTRTGETTGHRHAELIPLCLDEARGSAPGDPHGRDQRRIDHVLVHCRGGFDADAVHALRTTTASYSRDHRYFVTLVGLSVDSRATAADRERELAELARTIPAVASATQWVSSTPFVPPRFLKARGKDDLVGQVRAELASRGLPDASVEVEVLDDARQPAWVEATGRPTPSPRYRAHRRERLEAERKPPQRLGYHLRLTFNTAVAGPIALGYASHFGLGVFEPA